MRFDQIHSSIKSIASNGNFISKRREKQSIKSIKPNGKWNAINKRRQKQLINLIEEHKSVSYEIHKLNLMLR